MVIQVLNFDKCLKKFGDLSKISMMPVVKDATRKVQRKAKELAPVDTGDLMRSISVRFDSKREFGFVFTDLEYAPYQEFGTVDMPAQPYLIPAAEALKEEIQNDFIEYIQEELKRNSK